VKGEAGGKGSDHRQVSRQNVVARRGQAGTDGLGIGHLLELALRPGEDALRLALDDAELEPGVRRLQKNLGPVEAVEDVGRVLASDVRVDERGEAARMEFAEFGEVVDDRVDDDPL
jgi:hypothetical protein